MSHRLLFCVLGPPLLAACLQESVLVRSPTAPTARLVNPSGGEAFDPEVRPIPLLGVVDDADDPPAELFVWWVLDGEARGDAADDEGRVSVNVDPVDLATGWHSIQLHVVDSDGEADRATALFRVLPQQDSGEGSEDPPDDPPPDGGDDDWEDPDPPAAPRPPLPGDLRISEVMANPLAEADAVAEWVEVYNDSADPLMLDDLVLRDDDIDAFTLATSAVVEPGGYAVLCAEDNPVFNGGAACDAEFEWIWNGGGFAMANIADEVVLALPDGTEIDRLMYGEGFVHEGASTGRDGGAWCVQETVDMWGGDAGTPGAPNDPC